MENSVFIMTVSSQLFIEVPLSDDAVKTKFSTTARNGLTQLQTKSTCLHTTIIMPVNKSVFKNNIIITNKPFTVRDYIIYGQLDQIHVLTICCLYF